MAKPVLSDPIALRLPVELLQDVETVAAASERSRSWVIVRALKYYMLAEGRDVLQTLAAEAAVARGEVMDMDVLLQEFADLDAGVASAEKVGPRDDAV